MYYIGIDLGGTNIAAAVVNEEYRIIGHAKLKTGLPRLWTEILTDMAECARLAAENGEISFSEIGGVGVGAPGSVDPETGMVAYANNLDFHDVPMKAFLEEKLGLPCRVANDGNAAAFGEMLAGAGKGSENFVAITIGTGLGGGIIINRKIYTGYNGGAGECGHFVIQAGGEPCTCGRKGCCEAYVSATALIRQTRTAMEKDKTSRMWELAGSLEEVDAAIAFEAAKLGDRTAACVVDTYLDYLSETLINLINIFQPETICIGGGVSNEGDALLIPLLEKIKSGVYTRDSEENTAVCIAKLGNDAGIIGAAFLHLA